MPKQSQGPRLVRRKNKPNWFIRYIDEQSGKQKDKSTGRKDREDAEGVLEEFLRQRRTKRTGLAVMPNQFTIAQALDDYAHFKMGSASAERLSYSMEHILEFWQDQTLDFVNIETIESYRRRGVANKRAQSTVRRELIDLRSAINHAINMNRVMAMKFPKLPKDSPPKQIWLTETEFAKLLWASGQDFRSKFTLRLFLVIAFYTGARKSAIMELEWEQIDFEKNTINFNKVGMEETKKQRAFIPMPPEVRRFLLRRFQRYSNQNSFIFHQLKNPGRRVKSIDKGFRSATKRAKLKGVTPHTLRHTRVSLLLQSGFKQVTVSEFVKVSQPTIDKVYGHHSNADLKEMANNLGRTRKVRTTNETDEENMEKQGKRRNIKIKENQ